MILASVRKSVRALSVAPGFNVLMATFTSGPFGILSLPLQTSPNSPILGKEKREKQIIY